MDGFEFCGRSIGSGHPPFIVAEIGFNHNGDAALCRQMIEAAAENGADAVKLQTFTAEELYSKRFMANDPADPKQEIPLYEFFKRSELKPAEYKELFEYAGELGIPLFSTPFDEGSLDMLVNLGMPAVKVASPDLTYLDFIRRVAKKNLPVVLSTGMGDVDEIGQAVKAVREEGNDRIVLLHCVSNYPSRYEEMNMRCLTELKTRFKVPVGLSDHTTDNLSAVVAASLGAVMIEKHFTLDRNLPGADNAMSMEPHELRQLKQAAVDVGKILGDEERKLQPSEEPVKKSARRSLVARLDIEPGTVVTADMVSVKRPGTGIPPEGLARIVGKKAKSKISAEQIITWEMV
ncbi:MAG: N-acetylneuraminate synthase [Nitrospinaceae bacterium]|nr:MAG: N-acetylneuraminate synthase [Nitrospinaceae bacterium]